MLLQKTEGADVSEAAAEMTKKQKNPEAWETGSRSGSESTWTSDSTNENGHGVFSIQDKNRWFQLKCNYQDPESFKGKRHINQSRQSTHMSTTGGKDTCKSAVLRPLSDAIYRPPQHRGGTGGTEEALWQAER